MAHLCFLKIENKKGREINDFTTFTGGPEGDRTLDLTDANRALIPAELRAQMTVFCCADGPA